MVIVLIIVLVLVYTTTLVKVGADARVFVNNIVSKTEGKKGFFRGEEEENRALL